MDTLQTDLYNKAWENCRRYLANTLWHNLIFSKAEQKVALNARDLMQDKDWDELVAIYGRERTDLEESAKSFEAHRMVEAGGNSDSAKA